MNSSPCTPPFQRPQLGGHGASYFLDYVDLRDRTDLLSGLIASWRQSVRMKSIDQAEAFITSDKVKGNCFDVLGLILNAARAYA